MSRNHIGTNLIKFYNKYLYLFIYLSKTFKNFIKI